MNSKKRNNGFTLIELLAVIVILIIIFLIATPFIINILNGTKEEALERTIERIEKAAENYVYDKKLVNSIGEEGLIIPVSELKEYLKKIDEDLLNESVLVTVENDKLFFRYMGVKDGTIGAIYKEIVDSGVDTYNYMGGTYFKGDIKNNYVWYNGFIWRIMGKNANGSIRLITEEDVTAIPWGASFTAQDYSSSYIKDWVNNYFLPRLKDTSKIVNTTFCEDGTLVTDSSARTTCSNSVSAKAGTLSLDEYNLAGESSSYLVNGQDYYTLTPRRSSDVWCVGNWGYISGSSSDPDFYGVRAVISISSDTIVTGGDGTLTANSDTEYVAGQTLDNVTGTLGYKAGSGEYVKFDGRLYRIVEHTGSGTKLILDGFYDVRTAYGENFADMSSLLTSSNFLNWLAQTRQADILNTTWYRGDYFTRGDDYKTNLASTTNPFTNKAGLIRVGEMLAGQSLSLISINYSEPNHYLNTNSYWTLTQKRESSAFPIDAYCYSMSDGVSYELWVRPVIMIDSNITITSGNGTLSSPYEV